ncbi:uncharacterized protein LOC142622491 isoform X1 [Castanea sativa]|uniref:uncharacterized protein LOC142622491 isoform X1 n=1 Tax=Castanea sativa TaxID=21020 RepID=UPI003F64DEBF
MVKGAGTSGDADGDAAAADGGDVPDLEKGTDHKTAVTVDSGGDHVDHTSVTVVVSSGDSLTTTPQPEPKPSTTLDTSKQELPTPVSPKKPYLSRTTSSPEQCRVCQQEKEEVLIDLGCHCRGGLAKAHRSCIDTWFRSKGSNKCEICQELATNVPPPDSQPSQTNYWVWRIENYRLQNHERGCISPLWVAFAILIGGLLLDVLISITLGVSALPINIIIGVIVVLGLGTALRLALEFVHEWHLRRAVQSIETNGNLGYHPTL